ncbi:beta strand repeat-containing protein [Sulfurimonas sp.]|uniref:beta strand repeat-containing protein n=1 Tax=Sulfurimonas sp. TaxID=2022749 RepID=UPI003569BEC1
MTINKSLISIAAATLLAASFVGCSSDDSSTAATTTSTASTTAAIQTAVQAVDGYIYNATAKAHYLAEDNASMKTVALTSTPTTKEVVSGVVTLGSSTYSLPADTNSSVKSRIKFFSIATKASSTSGTVFTPAAYIEADGVNGYDVNDTQLGTTVILAPGNSPIASPITSMIVSNNAATFGGYAAAGGTVPTSLVDLNATTFAEIEANATKIATNLGLTGVNLLTADPVQLASTNPTYKLVTALLKGAGATEAAAILAATPATTLAGTLTTLASAITDVNAKALATSLAASATNGAFTTSDIAGMNIEKSVVNGTIQSLTPPTTTGKFALDAIEINNVVSSTFASTGAKIANTAMLVDFNMTNTDGNISNTAFKLVLALSGDKSTVASNDSNKSGAIVVELPFEINSTKTTSNALAVPAIANGTLIKWEAKASDGNQVVAKSDINASALGVTGVVTASGNVVTVDAKTLINQIVTAADANLTGVTGLSTGNLNGIANLQIALVDSTGAIVGVSTDGANASPIAKTSITSITGGISATEAIKVINLGTTDLRGTANTANTAPSVTSMDGNASGSTVIWNYTNAAPITNTAFTVVTTEDTGETNNSVVVSGLPSWVTVTAATVTSQAATNNMDFNLTVDLNQTLGDTNTTSTWKVTDEFGKANTVDGNLSFFFNAYPVITVQTDANGSISNFTKVSATHYTADINTTKSTGAAVVFKVINLVGETNSTVSFTDLNGTVSSAIAYVAGATGEGNVTLTDVNNSNSYGDFNMTINEANGALSNVVLDFNTSI